VCAGVVGSDQRAARAQGKMLWSQQWFTGKMSGCIVVIMAWRTQQSFGLAGVAKCVMGDAPAVNCAYEALA